jgi:hypothetical protein
MAISEIFQLLLHIIYKILYGKEKESNKYDLF